MTGNLTEAIGRAPATKGAASISRQWDAERADRARALCRAFLNTAPAKRFVMGLNVYASAVAAQVEMAGFVDDFTGEASFAGKPVVRMADLPADAFVLAVAGGRPLTVRRLLDNAGLRNVDYFTFHTWSGLDLPEAVFNEGFRGSFDQNRDQVDWLFGRLADEESRETLRKLFSFRYTYDLDHLAGFTERQTEQYFEPFFRLSGGQPVFVDVGGFDGFTSEEFIRRAPDFAAVYIFEPDAANGARCQQRLSRFANVHLMPFGAGREDATLRFSSDGSASSIREDGDCEIHIRRIDDVVDAAPTFFKVDIEGAEMMALEGARDLLARHRPVLALAVYHRPSDFWNIPRMIEGIAAGYKIYLRHYTESIYETVMYFVPPEYEAG